MVRTGSTSPADRFRYVSVEQPPGRRFAATRRTSIAAERHTHFEISMAAW